MSGFCPPEAPVPGRVPATPGVYAWWRQPSDLVYIGIAPARATSRATLRSRIRQHLHGNISASTLRRSLAALLVTEHEWLPRTTPSGRLWLGECGERALTYWMQRNLLVSWMEHEAPWDVEARVIAEMRPRLNLGENDRRDASLTDARGVLRAAATVAPTPTVTLYRPVGQAELDLVAKGNWRAFPPRLPGQPIFYPVLNEEYAIQIARDWNTKDPASGLVGYVTCFEVDAEFAARFEQRQVGGVIHRELWVPAEELDDFNRHIVGRIHLIGEFRGPCG